MHISKRCHRWITLGLVAILVATISSWAWLKRSEHLREEQERLDAINSRKVPSHLIFSIRTPEPSPFRLLPNYEKQRLD